jgi:hypothetical protein
MIEETILKHDVFMVLFLDISINESIFLMSILHAHLTNIITFRLVKYPRSYEYFSPWHWAKRALRFSVFFQLFATFLLSSTKKADILAFSLIRSEVIVNKMRAVALSEGCPINRCSLSNVSILVSKLIVRRFARNPAERSSIEDIFNEFENHDFRIRVTLQPLLDPGD